MKKEAKANEPEMNRNGNYVCVDYNNCLLSMQSRRRRKEENLVSICLYLLLYLPMSISISVSSPIEEKKINLFVGLQLFHCVDGGREAASVDVIRFDR